MICDLWASESWLCPHAIWLAVCSIMLAACVVVGWLCLNRFRSEINDSQSRVKLFGHELRRLGRRIDEIAATPQGDLVPLVESAEKTSVTQLLRDVVGYAEEAADGAQTRVQDHRTRIASTRHGAVGRRV